MVVKTIYKYDFLLRNDYQIFNINNYSQSKLFYQQYFYFKNALLPVLINFKIVCFNIHKLNDIIISLIVKI